MLLSRFAPTVLALGALTVLGCSDAVPPPAEGGVYFRIFPGSDRPAGTACNRTTGHEAKIPGDTFPRAAGIGPWSENSIGKPVIDGENDASVTCRVAGGSVRGRIRFQGVSFAVLSGNVPASGGGGSVHLASFDPKGLNMQSPADKSCIATTLQRQDGAAWVTFQCGQYHDPSNPSTSACAAEGVFLLQNCEQ